MGKSSPERSNNNGGELKKGPWTVEEDQKLTDYIQKNGHGRWRTLPKNAGLKRCGKSCRLRWTNYLRPDIKRGKFSPEEEETIIQLHRVLGNKWSAMAARLPGRTDNEIKNYWNTHIKKKLLRMGIDPVTHSPRLDLLELSSILGSSICNSSYTNPSNLLGLGSLINSDFLNLATALLSSQTTTTTITTPPFNPQNPQQNLLQYPVQASTSSSSQAQFLNEPQFITEANMGIMFCSNPTTTSFGCDNILQTYGYDLQETTHDSNQSTVDSTVYQNQSFLQYSIINGENDPNVRSGSMILTETSTS